MSAIGGGAAAGAVEDYFKKYLIACEYLQIDPTKVYELEFIKQRIVTVRSQWFESDGIAQVKKLNKRLNWFENNYLKLAKKGFWNYGFTERSEKLSNKGKLKIHEGSVHDTYVKCELSQKNYDFYSRNHTMYFLIVIGILLAILMLIYASSFK